MKFGCLFLFTDPEMNRPYTELVREVRECAVAMEQLGYDYVWLGEHHLGLEGFGNAPNPLLIATEVAHYTSKIRIGFAALIPTLWHPLRLAEDIAVLDHLTEGRIEIGFGRGPWPRDTVPFHPKADPRDEVACRQLMRENIEVLQKAWTNDVFSHHGPNWDFPPAGIPWNTPYGPPDPESTVDGMITKLSVAPKPYQKPYPPLWATVETENSLQQTAELGFNAITWRAPVRRIRHWREQYAEIRKAQGKDMRKPREIWSVMRHTYLAPTMEEARRDSEDMAMKTHGFVASFHSKKANALRFYMNPGEEPTPDMEMNWDFLMDRHLLVGPPDHVVEKVEEIQEVSGVDQLFIAESGSSHKNRLRSLELFGTKVMPRFKDTDSDNGHNEAGPVSTEALQTGTVS